MPLYDYLCDDCQNAFEVKRSFAEASQPATCPDCQGENTKKLLQRINIGVSTGQSGPAPASIPLSMGGGCCGGASCGCSGH